jgi:hypothetical protein
MRRHRKAEDDFSLKNFETILLQPKDKQQHFLSNNQLFEI